MKKQRETIWWHLQHYSGIIIENGLGAAFKFWNFITHRKKPVMMDKDMLKELEDFLKSKKPD